MKYIPLKYIREDPSVGNADDSSDAKESTAKLEHHQDGESQWPPE